MEIERKFLVKKLPEELEKHHKVRHKQGYISTDPQLRLRCCEKGSFEEYFFTFKSGKGLERQEFEFQLTKEQFDNLWQLIADNSIVEKDRYFIPLDSGFVAELDIFAGRLGGLITIEVEFENVEQASTFTPPHWFGEDVTNDERYSNSNMQGWSSISTRQSRI